MAMRMTANQERQAFTFGEESFHAARHNILLAPEFHTLLSPVQQRELAGNIQFEARWYFNRNDISPKQRQRLENLFCDGYESAYNKYMLDAMRPKTKEESTLDSDGANLISSFINDLKIVL